MESKRFADVQPNIVLFDLLRYLITNLLLFSSTLLVGQSVEGRWTTYNEQTGSPLSMIEIVKSGNSIEGRVSQIFLEPFQGEDPICTKCSGERKGKKVIGMNFLWGFKNDEGEWTEGNIIDPQDGEVYSSKLWLEDNNTMKVRGYGGMMGLFYRTQTWKRIGTSQTSSPIGLWNTIDDTWNKVKSEVEIVARNDELLGYIRKIFLLPHEGTDPVCTECDGDLKNTKVVGMKIIWDFKKEGDKWVDGKILDPGNGNVYTSSIWLIDADNLKVRGYMGPFYRSQMWRRTN